MDNERLEKRIRVLAEHAAPDKLGDILANCGRDDRKGTVIDMNNEIKKRKSPIKAIVAVAAAVALICAAGFIGYSYGHSTVPTEDAVIMLDVNPSVSISVGRAGEGAGGDGAECRRQYRHRGHGLHRLLP